MHIVLCCAWSNCMNCQHDRSAALCAPFMATVADMAPVKTLPLLRPTRAPLLLICLQSPHWRTGKCAALELQLILMWLSVNVLKCQAVLHSHRLAQERNFYTYLQRHNEASHNGMPAGSGMIVFNWSSCMNSDFWMIWLPDRCVRCRTWDK